MGGLKKPSRKMGPKLQSENIAELKSLLPERVRCNVSLKKISRWKVGGIADVLVAPQNTQELAILRAWIHKKKLNSVVIGSTSNLLFSDEGLRAIGIHITPEFDTITISDNEITAASGVWVPKLARTALLNGLTGIEHICGIPGTLGGLIYMNGGSQRKGIGDVVSKVESMDHAGNLKIRNKDECSFAYRNSIFQSNGEIILSATLELDKAADKFECRRTMLKILKDRRKKFPQKLPNCGSVFVSNPAMYAEYGPPGKVIEEVGLKGFKVGKAIVSEQHANFILNTGNATAKEILSVIASVKNSVAEKTGYEMAVEARYINPNGETVTL